MGRMSSMRLQSLVEIGGRMATEDEKTVFFVCMYVFLYVHCVPENVHLFIFQITLSKVNRF